MIYATVGYLGVQFVLALIKSSGVLITTFGKGFVIMNQYAIFNQHLHHAMDC